MSRLNSEIAAALFTGSRVYGQPTEKSDADMVILTDRPTLETLAALADQKPLQSECETLHESAKDSPLVSATLRFGKLNLIVCTTEAQFKCWALGTNDLDAKARAGGPCDRPTAVGVFQFYRKAHLGDPSS